MRSGYAMHRYVHRLLRDRIPAFSYSTDGAEMGKLMVAEGLGVTVLPDFSLIGDPLEQSGVITWRPLADDTTEVQLAIQRLRSGSPPRAVRDLHRIFTTRARAYTETRAKAYTKTRAKAYTETRAKAYTETRAKARGGTPAKARGGTPAKARADTNAGPPRRPRSPDGCNPAEPD
jgi:hypothetical protein